jgi:hypothetical protein
MKTYKNILKKWKKLELSRFYTVHNPLFYELSHEFIMSATSFMRTGKLYDSNNNLIRDKKATLKIMKNIQNYVTELIGEGPILSFGVRFPSNDTEMMNQFFALNETSIEELKLEREEKAKKEKERLEKLREDNHRLKRIQMLTKKNQAKYEAKLKEKATLIQQKYRQFKAEKKDCNGVDTNLLANTIVDFLSKKRDILLEIHNAEEQFNNGSIIQQDLDNFKAQLFNEIIEAQKEYKQAAIQYNNCVVQSKQLNIGEKWRNITKDTDEFNLP